MGLHEELQTYVFANWHLYTIIHAMIDAGQITSFECQADPCRRSSREFAKSGHRGQGDLLVLDHIIMRQDSGSHMISNLRISHLSCNSGWRRGKPGVVFTDEVKQQIAASVRQAHADGKFKKIYTPERLAKIRATKIARGQING